jgi:homoserine kinase
MNAIHSTLHSVTAFAPATCANVAVGFDILGFALESVGDLVTLTRRDDNKIIIESIQSAEKLPLETEKNTASLVIQKLCQDLKLNIGFSIKIQKGIPLSSGMGGSAASAVAALIACNAFLTSPLSAHQLAQYALLGEELASGQQHADNIVPCIFGGLTLIHSLNPMEIVQLPIPDVYCALVHPHLYVSTMEARKILKPTLQLKDYIKQSAHLAAFIAALYLKDTALLEKSLSDILIEPQRAYAVPGFYKIKEAALQAGALGMSFSGSGPSLFAFAKSLDATEAIRHAMQMQLKQENIESDYWISPISQQAAHVTQSTEA